MPVVSHKNFSVKTPEFDLTVRVVDGDVENPKVVFIQGHKHFSLAELENAIGELKQQLSK